MRKKWRLIDLETKKVGDDETNAIYKLRYSSARGIKSDSRKIQHDILKNDAKKRVESKIEFGMNVCV